MCGPWQGMGAWCGVRVCVHAGSIGAARTCFQPVYSAASFPAHHDFAVPSSTVRERFTFGFPAAAPPASAPGVENSGSTSTLAAASAAPPPRFFACTLSSSIARNAYS